MPALFTSTSSRAEAGHGLGDGARAILRAPHVSNDRDAVVEPSGHVRQRLRTGVP
jgi:hypothetical protein